MNKKLLLFFLISVVFLSPSIVKSVPAPFNEYYYNPETGQCINHRRGDENLNNPVPEGFYFSGLDDFNCTEKIFNETEYRECKSQGGEYVMLSLEEYNCYFDYSEEKKNQFHSYYIFSIMFFVILLSLIWLYMKK